MAVPAFTQFFPIVIRALADTQGPLSHRELRQRCIETFHLTQETAGTDPKKALFFSAFLMSAQLTPLVWASFVGLPARW